MQANTNKIECIHSSGVLAILYSTLAKRVAIEAPHFSGGSNTI